MVCRISPEVWEIRTAISMFLSLPYVVFFICSILESSLHRDSNGFFAPSRKIIYLSLSGTLRLARCLNQDSYNTKEARAEAVKTSLQELMVPQSWPCFLRQTQIPVKEKSGACSGLAM